MPISSNRRQFLIYSAAGAASLSTALRNSPYLQNRLELAWHNPTTWGIEGRGFSDTESDYDRLPARAKDSVRKPVWNLSRHSAGMSVRFRTDSSHIHVKYSLTNKQLAMPHMPATGVSGMDLYAKDSKGTWRWVSVLKPTKSQINSSLANNLTVPKNGLRDYMIYLPLYNGVRDFEIGVSQNATFQSISPRTERPLLFYGTSIMHGACASRSGMAIPAIVGRRLNRPTLNLGFSGNGRMENEVGKFLCELDPCIFAIDCVPNMNAQSVTERCEPLVRQIRVARPHTPILLVEDRVNTGAWIRKGATARHAKNQAALKRAFDNLVQAKVTGIHYLETTDLLGDDGDAATDGSHPSDLGMVRYANAYVDKLKSIL